MTARSGVKIAKIVQRLHGLGDEKADSKKKKNDDERRFTIMDLEKSSKKEKQDGSLATAFEQRLPHIKLNFKGKITTQLYHSILSKFGKWIEKFNYHSNRQNFNTTKVCSTYRIITISVDCATF